MNVDLPIKEIQVIPLGKAKAFSNYTADEVHKAIFPVEKSACACWNCCHGFDWAPCRIPGKKEVISPNGLPQEVYHCFGVFCTWNCAKAYTLKMSRCSTAGASTIALLANRCRRLHEGEKSSCANALFLQLPADRNNLKMFGGDMSIETFRRGCIKFDGTICGEQEDFLSLLPKKRPRENICPPAFINAVMLSTVRCNTACGLIQRPTNDSSFLFNLKAGKKASTKELYVNTEKSALSIREKMAQSKKQREMNGGIGGKNITLDRTMGICVTKKMKK
jgi:hypothetical protein